MSDKKPFWEGKTCNEMAGLHVKVTFKDGSIFTGKTNPDADIVVNYLTVRLSYEAGDDPFLPIRGIDTVELLDDPEYERIDDINAVRKGDVFVANDGNRYPVMNVDLDSMDADGAGCAVRVNGSVPGSFWIRNSMLAYALRRKPKLPDHDGLWLDKDNAIWQVYDHQAVPVYDDADGWGLQREVFSVSQLGQYAPFRPAKAVEA